MATTDKRFYHKQNHLKQLRAFCNAAQTGSISKAAEQMYLSQPSISLLVKALEKDMGGLLFDRRGPRIQLTEEGRILLDLALPLVEGLETLREAFIERCNNHVSGELNIAAGESTILYILPGIIKQFKTAYPHIQVKLSNVTGRDGLALLRNGMVDFAVGSMLDVPDDIIYIPTISYDPKLITAIDHPLAKQKTVTIQDIGQYGLILPPRHLTTWRMVDLVFKQHNVEYSVALEAGGWEVIKKYVAMGLGISIVTSICLSDNDSLAKISLNKYFPMRNYGLVVRRGKFLSPAARRFFSMMDKNVLDRFHKLSDKINMKMA
ncbi:MAG: LysR family transcriptional regulator [Gammaproteobacteria bacterium]